MLKKRLVKELSVDNVMARLPTFSRSKTTEVRDTVESLLKVISLLQLKNTVQEKTYREEIKYHKTVYQLQLEYIDHLFKSLRCGYSEFEKDASALICRPLSEVLRIYDTLKITASEEALRQFLKLFKQYEPQIAAAVAKLEVKESDPEVFSNFGEEFFEKLYLLEIDCQRERDENIERLQDVKERQEEYWQEIKTLFHNDASRDNRHESDTSRTESTTGRNSRSLSVLPSPHHEMEQPYNDKKESHSQLSSRSELTQEEPVPDSSTHESRNNVVLLPLIDKQRQTNKARRSSPLSRRPRSSSASRKNIHDKERRWESEQITTAHGESEELFKASLRADYDGGKGFDFTLDSEREDSSSNCTCGAEHSTEEHLVRAESTGMIHRDKPPSGRRDSPLRRNNRNNMSTSGNSSISSGKAIRPVPKTRLVLKPRVKRDMSAPASDSESDTSYYDNRNSKVESKTAESDIRRSSDVGLEGNNIEASFPYKTGGVKRSGSLPRSLMKTKQNSTSSPWK